MKEAIVLTSGIVIVVALMIATLFGIGWGVEEMEAHYAERQYQFEWALQQRTIAALLDSAERMIEIIKE